MWMIVLVLDEMVSALEEGLEWKRCFENGRLLSEASDESEKTPREVERSSPGNSKSLVMPICFENEKAVEVASNFRTVN
jgi:hypothetical protein